METTNTTYSVQLQQENGVWITAGPEMSSLNEVYRWQKANLGHYKWENHRVIRKIVSISQIGFNVPRESLTTS